MEIVKIIQTCGACPSQWEGKLKDGRMFYARYRWGVLEISVSNNPSNSVYDAINGVVLCDEQLGDKYDGVLGEDKLIDKMERCGFIFNKN